jgi:hypothetical protein
MLERQSSSTVLFDSLLHPKRASNTARIQLFLIVTYVRSSFEYAAQRMTYELWDNCKSISDNCNSAKVIARTTAKYIWTTAMPTDEAGKAMPVQVIVSLDCPTSVHVAGRVVVGAQYCGLYCGLTR